MNVTAGVIATVIAGLVGAAIWGGIAYFANVEIGYVAWGIGLLVGFAGRAACGGVGHVAVAGSAVLMTMLAIVGGKLIVLRMLAGEISLDGFWATFGLLDIVFFVLAVGTAFKLTAGEDA